MHLLAFAGEPARGTVNPTAFFQSVVRAIPVCEDEWQHQQLLRFPSLLKISLEAAG
jgi:hypothetical protein